MGAGGKFDVWSPVDDAVLQESYATSRAKELAIELDRSPAAVYQRARVLGLSRETRKLPEAVDLAEEERAYFAGFFDGEGCIGCTHSYQPTTGRRYYQLKVAVSNCHYGILVDLQRYFGGCISIQTHESGTRSTCWGWHITTRNALRFLVCVRPFLRIKAAQADAGIELGSRVSSTPPGTPITDEEHSRRKDMAAKIVSLRQTKQVAGLGSKSVTYG